MDKYQVILYNVEDNDISDELAIRGSSMDIDDADSPIKSPMCHFLPFRDNGYKTKSTDLGYVRQNTICPSQ